MICYIVGGLPCKPHIDRKSDDIIIAADKGYEHLNSLGIKPDLLLGDLDSIGYVPSGIRIEQHPTVKDDTDTSLAIEYGISKGYNTFIIYGCIGGLLDHTLANLQLLYKYTLLGFKILFIDDEKAITGIKNSKVTFSSDCIGRISIFALSDECFGVEERGLKYTLEDYTLSNREPLGVSNEFVGKEAQVSVEKGVLAIYTSTKYLI